jgi:hypothetical protein
MRWEAANVSKSPSKKGSEGETSGRRSSSETVEAALARLTKAYSTAISCVGAIHKLQSASLKDTTKIDEFQFQSQKLATAARSTFENATLLDPLIAKFAPTWTSVVVHELAAQDAETWSFATDKRPEPAVLTSSSHKTTVKEIAYLSLLNYADLLVASQKQTDAESRVEGILDSGVVKSLSLVGWDATTDQQLALVALCDAVELDGSDPVVWLKLACAARRYSRLVAGEGKVHLRYKRLERHALEMGKTALPPTVAPNRSIIRALQEHENLPDCYENDGDADEMQVDGDDKSPPIKLALDLPRYSWSILGRLLIRACREGFDPDSKLAFGSPCVELHLSHMLVLPPRSLGVICKYLENEEIWKFEATCRGLSANILSARALLEREESAENKPSSDEQMEQAKVPPPDDSQETQPAGSSNRGSDEPSAPVWRREDRSDEPARARSSKRVLSQLITSGKRAERESKRSSIRFCLLASTLHCTSDDEQYRKAHGDSVNWDRRYNSSTVGGSKGVAPTKDQGHEVSTVDSRLGDSCLTAFVEQWSKSNSGPFDILQRYVAHVARNVAEVFDSDQGSLALSGFVTECVDMLAKRAGICHSLDLCSYGKVDLTSGGESACLDYFTVNLLNAELRLKRSDGQLPGFGEYATDSNFIAVVVPELLHQASEIDAAHADLRQSKTWLCLKTRLHWLAAGFYLERSRLSQNIAESRLAEEFGMEQVEYTIECFSHPVKATFSSVLTPHLTSPRRTGTHWKVLSIFSLTSFRDDMQASSVVSGARQQFLEKLTEIEANWKVGGDEVLRKDDLEGLQEVGKTLFQRYHVSDQGDGGKHEELIDDFVAACADEISDNLKPKEDKKIGEDRWGSLWVLAPSGEPNIDRIIKVQNPSILTILMTCLSASDDGKLPVAHLLSRLAVFSFDLLRKYQKSLTARENDDDEFGDMSDDDLFSDEETEAPVNQEGRNASRKGGGDGQKESLVAIAAEFFVEKITHILGSDLTEIERQEYYRSEDCLALIKSSMAFVSNWYKPRGSRKASPTSGNHDLRIFLSMCSFNRAITGCHPTDAPVPVAEVSFFKGLCRTLLFQRHIFPIVLGSGNESRFGRSAKQKEFLGCAELVGAVLSEFAVLLSRQVPSIINQGCLQRSALVRAVLSNAMSADSPESLSLASIVEALLFMWNVVPRDDASAAGSVMGRIFSETLLVPIAASIVALCGSALSSRGDSPARDTLALSEFFDSDASSNEYGSDEEEITSKARKYLGLLQPLCQAIQGISLVVNNVDEKLSSRFSSKSCCERNLGPLFPLVVTRVLSFQADILLSEFGEKTADENLWGEYAYGTRSAGMLLDESLHKIYKQLYGITIVSHWVNQEKEKSCDDKSQTLKCPESTQAAAQLYRCIQRAYATSRKSIPKAALECVALALPEGEASPRRNDMRSFVFGKEIKSFSPKAVSRLVSGEGNWCEPFQVWYEAAVQLDHESTTKDSKDEIFMVRRGITRELAQAPLPTVSHDAMRGAKVDDTQKIAEERARASFQERELSKKFWAIVDDMSYGDPGNYEGWLRAAECVTMKAELIADRLGSSLGFIRTSDFSIPTDNNPRAKMQFSVAELEDKQERDYVQNSMGWTPFIGDDLSIYVDYQWSSFKSLEKCSGAVTSKYQNLATQIRTNAIDEESPEFLETRVWNEIEILRRKEDFIGWQQAWGGLFVEALRTIASRCLSMGFFLISKSGGTRSEEITSSLQSEVLESLGIAKYSQLMGSQGYGYPMKTISHYRKRELATAAQHCFEEAAKKVVDDDDQVTYDMLFMVGKCYEKVAKTYTSERFPVTKEPDGVVAKRSYERNMNKALLFYNKALEEAATLEEEGALPDAQAGGSSHGKSEVIYRLHASRLKCLIATLQHPEASRLQAQLEAIRLAKEYWYAESNSSQISDDTDPNLALWTILADIVAALAQCRLEHQFFHRSVYRHAQAMMWAPALHDPPTGLVSGSLGVVPATKSHLIRGLNSSTPCVNSADVIMAVLFEKKRPQLVSVWVTNASSSMSPFEVLNGSARKFDSLRGKYFHAHTETLKLCCRDSALESLFQQVVSTKRDLPSFYQASALALGGIPEASHLNDNLLKKSRSFHNVGLLRDAKRDINRALADVLLKEAPKTGAKNEYLKKCYACFLRLNTTVNQIEKMRSWKYNSSSLPEVEALCQVYLSRPESQKITSEPSDWSGGSKKTIVLKAAIKACSELFPSLANTLYRKNKPKKISASTSSRKQSESTGGDGSSTKRQNPENAATNNGLVQFVVDVPPGLAVGDKFETTVRIGSQMKTLRLTVPVGLPPKLKFSLKDPTASAPPAPIDEDIADPDSKRQKVDDP